MYDLSPFHTKEKNKNKKQKAKNKNTPFIPQKQKTSWTILLQTDCKQVQALILAHVMDIDVCSMWVDIETLGYC